MNFEFRRKLYSRDEPSPRLSNDVDDLDLVALSTYLNNWAICFVGLCPLILYSIDWWRKRYLTSGLQRVMVCGYIMGDRQSPCPRLWTLESFPLWPFGPRIILQDWRRLVSSLEPVIYLGEATELRLTDPALPWPLASRHCKPCWRIDDDSKYFLRQGTLSHSYAQWITNERAYAVSCGVTLRKNMMV
jgi:hypothetical protein